MNPTVMLFVAALAVQSDIENLSPIAGVDGGVTVIAPAEQSASLIKNFIAVNAEFSIFSVDGGCVADGVKYSRAVAPALTRSCCNAVPNAVSPVPPFVAPMAVALHVPVAIVPSVVIFDVPAHVESAVFSTLFSDISVFAVEALNTSGAPVPAVLRPNSEAVAISAILASVTALFAMVAAKLPVPLPVTSPVRLIVWSPVFVPEDVPEKVPLCVARLPNPKVVRASDAVASSTRESPKSVIVFAAKLPVLAFAGNVFAAKDV